MSITVKNPITLKGNIGLNPSIKLDNLILYIDPNNKNFSYLGETFFKNLAPDTNFFFSLTSSQPILSGYGAFKYLDFKEGSSLSTQSSSITGDLENYAIQIWIKDKNLNNLNDLTLKPFIVGGQNSVTLNVNSLQIVDTDTDRTAYIFDGLYYPIQDFDGKKRFIKDSTVEVGMSRFNNIKWLSADNSWNVMDNFDNIFFKSFSDVEYPWEATTWNTLVSSISSTGFNRDFDIGETWLNTFLVEYGFKNNKKSYRSFNTNTPVFLEYNGNNWEFIYKGIVLASSAGGLDPWTETYSSSAFLNGVQISTTDPLYSSSLLYNDYYSMFYFGNVLLEPWCNLID